MECGRIDIPGQKVGKFIWWSFRQPCQNVSQGEVGLESVKLDGLDQGVKIGARSGTPRSTRYHPIIPTDRERAYGPFRFVIIRVEPGTIEIAYQPWPEIERIRDRGSKRTFRKNLQELRIEPRFEIGQDRYDDFLSLLYEGSFITGALLAEELPSQCPLGPVHFPDERDRLAGAAFLVRRLESLDETAPRMGPAGHMDDPVLLADRAVP